ncbi:MAG: riboflavin synthase [Oscillibacter sp.]|nr:riboflavin synthase [Oscillibacter sp.]
MFTGIIEETGKIRAVERGRHSSVLSIGAAAILSDLKIGDSVAVSGVCLTATTVDSGGFTADVMHETLNRSTLGALAAGDVVNLERAMPADGRFGGHIVSGHIDGVGKITAIRRDDNAVWFTVEAPQTLRRYIVEKGSIAIDGISLTVAAADAHTFAVSVIPHTLRVTALGARRVGSGVNLETDIIGKYVESLLRPDSAKSNITREFLARNGF